ncbi:MULTISPECIES: D-alanyl-D-alanine carboxypeptidase family protein [unclassified Streptomyces]|uniref:D-alanyl-D-alanine carboxypeptidase family protein n=1 Tax=unclassified Streptomyces TaxID=2593676 RepID=UPI0006AE1200|nr:MULTISPECIES: D-alanyl-D-alanine carboxypeptidase [unclassified Streptomyces]KOX19613.1 D-alanyl-D-alanine carboxypeptidase [Streptomyces sp. NRRL F-6491]KOX37824.1 D-alanyl-D-alanine carboxypeptidase [Streptomyces sp. NRRL F-6492]
MIVTSAVRHAAAGSAALLFVLPVPAAVASPAPTVSSVTPVSSASSFSSFSAGSPASAVGEPTPPVRRSVDPARLDRRGVQVQPLSGAPRLPSASALSWVVADASTGEVLAARDAHRKLPPASTLKALFALTALPHHDSSAQHTVADSELTGIGAGSSLVGIKEGYTYKVSDLWNGVFLSSGNDAVHVLAAMNGGWDSMARKMQEKARSLGANDTHVVSPDGYDAPGQVSSAYDLAVFGRAGLQDPAFVRYCSTRYADFPAGSWSYGIANTNRLLTGENGVDRYPGLIGIKNGYTSNAGNTLVSAAKRGDRTLVVSVMNPQEGGGYAVYEEARSLLDWGFEAAGHVRPVGSLLPEHTKAEVDARAVAAARDGQDDGTAPEKAARAGAEAGTAPAGDTGTKEAPAKDAPAENGPTREAPVREAPAEDAPAREAPAKGSPARDGSTGDTPGGNAPAQAALGKDASPAAAPSGASAGLPLGLIGAACAAAFALWGWRRRAGAAGSSQE